MKEFTTIENGYLCSTLGRVYSIIIANNKARHRFADLVLEGRITLTWLCLRVRKTLVLILGINCLF
jgi:hypothetical protein